MKNKKFIAKKQRTHTTTTSYSIRFFFPHTLICCVHRLIAQKSVCMFIHVFVCVCVFSFYLFRRNKQLNSTWFTLTRKNNSTTHYPNLYQSAIGNNELLYFGKQNKTKYIKNNSNNNSNNIKTKYTHTHTYKSVHIVFVLFRFALFCLLVFIVIFTKI